MMKFVLTNTVFDMIEITADLGFTCLGSAKIASASGTFVIAIASRKQQQIPVGICETLTSGDRKYCETRRINPPSSVPFLTRTKFLLRQIHPSL